MSRDKWVAIDRYINEKLIPRDPALTGVLAASAAAELPTIAVAPNQGKFLMILAAAVGARRILEIGTLGGYSAIWLARALPPEGRLISLERDPKHAEVARANIAAAGHADQVEVRLGPALDILPRLAQEKAGPFDLVFIDADKANIPDYFQWALRLSRRGALIVVDNVVREGTVLDSGSADPDVQGVRRLNEMMGSDPRVSATALQTVGERGHDGFAIALVIADPA